MILVPVVGTLTPAGLLCPTSILKFLIHLIIKKKKEDELGNSEAKGGLKEFST